MNQTSSRNETLHKVINQNDGSIFYPTVSKEQGGMLPINRSTLSHDREHEDMLIHVC